MKPPGLQHIERAHLNTCAYVLREMLLAERTLHFACDQVWWSCSGLWRGLRTVSNWPCSWLFGNTVRTRAFWRSIGLRPFRPFLVIGVPVMAFSLVILSGLLYRSAVDLPVRQLSRLVASLKLWQRVTGKSQVTILLGIGDVNSYLLQSGRSILTRERHDTPFKDISNALLVLGVDGWTSAIRQLILTT
jgi:hypothetical protein